MNIAIRAAIAALSIASFGSFGIAYADDSSGGTNSITFLGLPADLFKIAR